MTNQRSFIKVLTTILCLLLLTCSAAWPVAGQKEQATGQQVGVPDGYMVVEGDILIRRSHYRSFISGAYRSANTQLWPNGVVPFQFDSNCGPGSMTCVSAANQTAMLEAMDVLEAVANIQFRQCFNNACTGNFVHVQANPQFNNSAIGLQGGLQVINIVSWGDRFIIVHELMHCLGFFHEQSRPGRGDFVTINTANVQMGQAGNFTEQKDATVYGPYDFDSLMHYDQCDFSIGCGTGANGNPIQACNTCPGQETITVNAPWGEQWQAAIGQRTHLSNLDKVTLSIMYPHPDWRFVDGTYTGQRGPSNGTFLRPYQSLEVGINATPETNRGVLWIQPGTYFANRIGKRIKLRAPLGGVTIRVR